MRQRFNEQRRPRSPCRINSFRRLSYFHSLPYLTKQNETRLRATLDCCLFVASCLAVTQLNFNLPPLNQVAPHSFERTIRNDNQLNSLNQGKQQQQ